MSSFKRVRICDEEKASSANTSEVPNLPGRIYGMARRIDSVFETVSGLCKTNSRFFSPEKAGVSCAQLYQLLRSL